jgi:hypothetical protein
MPKSLNATRQSRAAPLFGEGHRRSAEHLSGLIDGLLDISKIEAGRLQVYSNEINIHDFLDQIVEMFKPQAQAKGSPSIHVRSPSLPRLCAHRRETAAADPRQPVVQRHQVHRRGQCPLRRRLSQRRLRVSPSRTAAAASPRKTCRASSSPSSAARLSIKTACPASASGLTITRLWRNARRRDIKVHERQGRGSSLQRAPDAVGQSTARGKHCRSRSSAYAAMSGRRRTVLVVDDNEDHREPDARDCSSPLDFIVLTAGRRPRIA